MATAMLPVLFYERLREIIPPDRLPDVLHRFGEDRPVSVRVNTLKSGVDETLALLRQEGIACRRHACCPQALVVDVSQRDLLSRSPLILDGLIYRQSLSSMLPVRALDPGAGDNVLDMCAAPGSKATQIAALMENQGSLVAIEAVRSRYYKLKSVANLCGVRNIMFHCMDARRYRARGLLFDKILLDAPCSSEGRFHLDDPKTFAYWSPRKIQEMARKQRGLLLSASRLLKPGGRLVYATCTFAPEENEGVVDWLLKKTAGAMRMEPCQPEGVTVYPAITSWRGKIYSRAVEHCCRILPDEDMEGFFICQLVRLA